jgi:hypothetical protein
MQIIEENVAGLGDGVTVVGAALAPEALSGKTVNFVGQEDKYWAFHVLPDSELTPNMMVMKVPTKSLSDIQVSPMHCDTIVVCYSFVWRYLRTAVLLQRKPNCKW